MQRQIAELEFQELRAQNIAEDFSYLEKHKYPGLDF